MSNHYSCVMGMPSFTTSSTVSLVFHVWRQSINCRRSLVGRHASPPLRPPFTSDLMIGLTHSAAGSTATSFTTSTSTWVDA